MIGVSQNNKVQFGCDLLYNTTITNDGARHMYEMDVAALRCRFDGIDVATISASPVLPWISLYLFLRHRIYTQSDCPMAGRMYSAKFMDSVSIVRDFIPVIDWHDEPCMYDQVTKTLFYNQGTGSFVAGPDL